MKREVGNIQPPFDFSPGVERASIEPVMMAPPRQSPPVQMSFEQQPTVVQQPVQQPTVVQQPPQQPTVIQQSAQAEQQPSPSMQQAESAVSSGSQYS